MAKKSVTKLAWSEIAEVPFFYNLVVSHVYSFHTLDRDNTAREIYDKVTTALGREENSMAAFAFRMAYTTELTFNWESSDVPPPYLKLQEFWEKYVSGELDEVEGYLFLSKHVPTDIIKQWNDANDEGTQQWKPLEERTPADDADPN